MKNMSKLFLAALGALALALAPAAYGQTYNDYNTKVGITQDGDTLFVKSGGTITTLSGSTVDLNGTCSAGNLAATDTTDQLVLGTTDTTTITSPAPAADRTYTIPDFGGAANFVLGDANTYKVDGIAMTPYKCVDSTVTAALLDSAGSVTVIAGVTGDQWKLREAYWVGAGTNFGSGGNRLISLTDGTTVWTTLANADIESVPATTLRLGDAKIPFLTGTSNTKSASNAAIRWQYSGGTTDHSATGSIVLTTCWQKTD